MGTLLQALEIIFEMQRTRNNEIKIKIKISFPTYNTRFFFLLWTPNPIFKPHNFHISYSFKTI